VYQGQKECRQERPERNTGRKVHLNFYEHQYTHGFSASINNQFISVPLLRNQLLKKKKTKEIPTNAVLTSKRERESEDAKNQILHPHPLYISKIKIPRRKAYKILHQESNLFAKLQESTATVRRVNSTRNTLAADGAGTCKSPQSSGGGGCEAASAVSERGRNRRRCA